MGSYLFADHFKVPVIGLPIVNFHNENQLGWNPDLRSHDGLTELVDSTG
jgi:hypothetical protein